MFSLLMNMVSAALSVLTVVVITVNPPYVVQSDSFWLRMKQCENTLHVVLARQLAVLGSSMDSADVSRNKYGFPIRKKTMIARFSNTP